MRISLRTSASSSSPPRCPTQGPGGPWDAIHAEKRFGHKYPVFDKKFDKKDGYDEFDKKDEYDEYDKKDVYGKYGKKDEYFGDKKLRTPPTPRRCTGTPSTTRRRCRSTR